jgi:hypothetical protein
MAFIETFRVFFKYWFILDKTLLCKLDHMFYTNLIVGLRLCTLKLECCI